MSGPEPDGFELLSGNLEVEIALFIECRMPTRILFIDDEPLIRSVATEGLTRSGYLVTAPEVEHRPEAERAVALAHAGAFDAVVVDLRLPHIDPADLLPSLAIARPDCPVILIAGFLPEDVEYRFRALGASECLEKPFSTCGLRASIERCLSWPRRQAPHL